MTEAPAPIIGSVDEFARVADLGLGRAVLFLRQHDAAPYRDALLYACTHYTAYDWQIEGRRTTYLYELVQAAGDAGSFVDSIVTALRETTSRRDADQLVSLMARFAEDGHTPARAAMYETLERDDTEEAFIGYDAIIDLDGLDGFLHVADRMGAAVLTVPPSLADDEHWKLTAALGDAEERCGKDRVRQALERAAMESSRIQAYIRSASAEEAKYSAPGRDRPALHDIPYEEIRQAIIGKEPGRFSRWALDLWGRAASDDDLARAAVDLLKESDEERLARYLDIFARRPFPLQLDRLLSLAKHPSDRLMLVSTTALSMIEDSCIRKLALELIADPSLRGWRKSRGVDLLRSNFQPGDESLLASLLQAPRELDEYHAVGFSALAVFEAYPSADAALALLALYEHGPCTLCRKRAVKHLHQLGRLPTWVLEECRYDASMDVRETAESLAHDGDASSA